MKEMKATVYSLEGKEVKEITLPLQFEEEYREDLIRRAVLSEESKEKQPKGNYRFAGMETSTKYRGRKEDYGSLKNKGQAMLPREVVPNGGMGRVKRIPSAVKGRRAHPPKVEEKIIEKMNNKEYKKALRSALRGSTIQEVVGKRIEVKGIKLPIIVEDSFEKVSKINDVITLLEKLKLDNIIEQAKERVRRKTGLRCKRTKLIKRAPKYILFVCKDGKIKDAAENLSGVDARVVSNLRVKDLSPGAIGGRITIFTEAAIKEISEKL